ncbi:hypothetical protein HG535_0H02480 [Zygotorulaspora mrakii]|uniref:Uncharacterized protein n=1 Tax=Zygotorulaspora mrakii TaxID=42260 RepID=A0A7H9B845_ZYGMR|nr:uncharacterized protein HG535_0H02480 [Zygotorulaspora mrakii]QLG74921.1 hypothetical protein HG535_0H02480 [Zygotorulaspora mrakii]
MGISGLLPQLKAIQNPVSLHRYEGQTLGIDGYAWLHRAACSCAMELSMDKPTSKYLEFFIKKIGMLKAFKIDPYLIFDGDSIGVKKDTEIKRRTKRIESRNIAQKLWESGEKKNAMDYFLKSVDITPEMAKCIIDYCKLNGIRYIVAPFEADAQMVYLEKKHVIQGIISEDSDLLIFGCHRLITKLNDFGECIEICRDDFNKLPRKFPMYQLTEDEIRIMVCLSGCDYTDGIPKVGLITAMKLVIRFGTLDKILLHIQREGKLKIPIDFIKQYELANFAFQYQRIFCPIRCKMATLNEIPEQLLHCEELYNCIGNVVAKNDGFKKIIARDDDIDHNLHYRISRGELSPYDCRKLLVNREHKLQLSSKSDLQTIDSFFKMDSKQHNVCSLLKHQSASIAKETLGSNKILESDKSYMFDKFEKFDRNDTNDKIDKIDKIDAAIKRRKLNRDSKVELLTSKFFKASSVGSTSQSAATETFTDTPSTSAAFTLASTQEDVQTEIPESQLPTQIPSSFNIGIPDEEDLSEILSELEDDNDECQSRSTIKRDPKPMTEPISVCSRILTGSTVALEQFRFSNNRVPLQSKNINNRSDVNIRVSPAIKSSNHHRDDRDDHHHKLHATTLRGEARTPVSHTNSIVVRARTTSQPVADKPLAQRPAIRTSLSARFIYKPT